MYTMDILRFIALFLVLVLPSIGYRGSEKNKGISPTASRDAEQMTLCAVTPTSAGRDHTNDYFYQMFRRQTHVRKKLFVYRNGEIPEPVARFWENVEAADGNVKFENTNKQFLKLQYHLFATGNTDSSKITLGDKRNHMVFEMAKDAGCDVFISFDDDDFYSANYFSHVAEAYAQHEDLIMTQMSGWSLFQAKTDRALELASQGVPVQQQALENRSIAGWLMSWVAGWFVGWSHDDATWWLGQARPRYEGGFGWMHTYRATLFKQVQFFPVSWGEEIPVVHKATSFGDQAFRYLHGSLGMHIDVFNGTDCKIAGRGNDLFIPQLLLETWKFDTIPDALEHFDQLMISDNESRSTQSDRDFFCGPHGYPNPAVQLILCEQKGNPAIPAQAYARWDVTSVCIAIGDLLVIVAVGAAIVCIRKHGVAKFYDSKRAEGVASKGDIGYEVKRAENAAAPPG